MGQGCHRIMWTESKGWLQPSRLPPAEATAQPLTPWSLPTKMLSLCSASFLGPLKSQEPCCGPQEGFVS